MPLSRGDAERLEGTRGVVRDTAGAVVGTIASLLLEEGTGEPTWVRVDGVAPGRRTTFIPLLDANIDGTDIVLSWSKVVVDQAPRLSDSQQLDPSDERLLQAYYANQKTRARTASADADQTFTRSVERLRVGVSVRPRERVRLVRHVVTEDVTITVPVQHEELRIERIPFDEDGQALRRHDTPASVELGEYPFDQDEIEMVLHEERVVVSTEVVPVERVRLRVHVLTEDVQIAADLQAENIELV